MAQDFARCIDSTLTVDGFEVLDACHRQMLFALGKLAALVSRLHEQGADDHARQLAAEITAFFSTVAHSHHEDEERHVFPVLLAAGRDDLAQDVRRLQQDHRRIERDWHPLHARLESISTASAADIDVLGADARAFTELLHDHIALEEVCIYPEARARLVDRERCEMGREMAARRRHR
jgi:hemerythrin-like domain-containing protein